MSCLDSIQSQVLKLLEEMPSVRNSDERLVYEFTLRYCKFPIDLELLGFSVKMIKNLLRARRKCQELRPDLKAVDEVSNDRAVLAANFRKNKGEWTV